MLSFTSEGLKKSCSKISKIWFLLVFLCVEVCLFRLCMCSREHLCDQVRNTSVRNQALELSGAEQMAMSPRWNWEMPERWCGSRKAVNIELTGIQKHWQTASANSEALACLIFPSYPLHSKLKYLKYILLHFSLRRRVEKKEIGLLLSHCKTWNFVISPLLYFPS